MLNMSPLTAVSSWDLTNAASCTWLEAMLLGVVHPMLQAT